MAFIFSHFEHSGVLFYFKKCGTTMINQKSNASHKIVDNGNYEQYKTFRRTEPQYLLVRHPIKRFISGYYHYWRHWHDDFNDTKKWMQRKLNRFVHKQYSMDDHIDLCNIITAKKNAIPDEHWKEFYDHCVHNLADEYVQGMRFIRLGQPGDNDFLRSLLDTKIYNGMYDETNNYNYPDLHLSNENKQYIISKYGDACDLFGYDRNDY